MNGESCQGAHSAAKPPAACWSWVFGMWLCRSCLERLTEAEAQRTPGAYLDKRPVVTR